MTMQRSELRQRDLVLLLDHEDREIALRAHAVDRGNEFLHDQRRQPLDRLVEQQQRWIGRQRPRNRQHLLLAAGSWLP